MQLFATVSRWLGWPRRELPARYADGWQAGTPLDDARSPGPIEGFAALRRGLEILAGQLTSTPMLVFNGADEVPGSAPARCLRRTDPADLECAVFDMLQTGNGWLRIERDKTGAPARLVAVQAFRMSAAIEAGTCVYRCDGQAIDAAEFVHLQCRNGFSPYVGDALVDAYSTTVGAVLSTIAIYRQLQGNGSHAEAALVTDSALNAAQALQLREAYNEQAAQARGKAGGVVILTNGLKPAVFRRLPSALDADIIRSLEFGVAEASRMTGVPLSMLGVKDSVAYNSAIEAHRSFYRMTIRPLMHRIEQELSRKLGADVRYDAGEITLGHGIERADVLSKLLYAGVISVNEARQATGYTPVDGGDVAGRPANTLPLPVWLESGRTAPAEPPKEPTP